MARRNNYLTYKKKFKEILNDRIPIYNVDGILLESPEKKEWKQCYAPNDSVRKEYPKYVFISKDGNLVSVNNKEPRWLKPSLTYNGRESYKLSKDGKTKASIGYIIVAVCFGAKTFGKADEVMAAKGRDAFGMAGELLQVHHEDGYVIGDHVASNNPDKMVILTVNVHKLFNKVPTEQASEQEEFEFLKEFAYVVSKETNEPVIMIPTGNRHGTISEIWNDENVIKFCDDEWTFLPIVGDHIELAKEWAENEKKANIIFTALKEYCTNWLDHGRQSIFPCDIDDKLIQFIVFRK